MNTKQQSAIGVAKAIEYYTNLGYAVFVPIVDFLRYDIIVDNGNGPKRVEVKTTNSKRDSVMLRTLGGNQSWSGEIKRISSEDCDLVFCLNCNSGNFKVFPSKDLEGKHSVTVH